MNRQEELERKQARNRKEYDARKAKRLERQRELSRKWYWANREYCLAKSAADRQRRRDEATFTPKPTPPSIESIEASMPEVIRRNIKRYRKEFLKIPILERPPYDEYLRRLAKPLMITNNE